MRLPALLPLVLLVGCGPAFFAEGEVEQVCQNPAEFEIEGVPAALAAHVAQEGIEREVPFNMGDVMPQTEMQGLGAETRLAEVTITPVSGLDTFAGFDVATVELLASPES